MNNILLSYPRSGNHLVRFFIELLTEIPTYGCIGSNMDIEIYKNKFSENIPFNITNFDKKDCYIKYHNPSSENIHTNNLILIIRNPKEVLLRHNNYKLNISDYEIYFKNIDFYNNHKGKKLLLYYEDIITNKTGNGEKYKYSHNFCKNRPPSYSLKEHRDLVVVHQRASAPVVYRIIDASAGDTNSYPPHHLIEEEACCVVISDWSLDRTLHYTYRRL